MGEAGKGRVWIPRSLGADRLEGTWLLPMLVWLATVGVVVAAAVLFGYDPARSATWSRWDSVHYLEIAHDGYDLFPCTVGLSSGTWCGDAGWFPGYPLVVGLLAQVGAPLAPTAVVVSWLFTAGTLALLWATFLGRRFSAAALTTLLFAAAAPGQIYGYAIFPMSMLAFFSVACFWFLQRCRWIAAGCAGAGAAAAYPLGVLLIPVVVVWLLVDRSVRLRERLRRVAWVAGLTTVGAAVMPVAQRIQTAHWNAYLLVQEKYDHNVRNPILSLRIALQPLRHGSPLELAKVPAIQTGFVAAVVAVVVASVVIRSVRSRSIDRLDLLLVLWAVTTWAFPLSQTNLAQARSQAALLPAAILVGRLPLRLSVPIVVVAAAIAVAMEKLFLRSILV